LLVKKRVFLQAALNMAVKCMSVDLKNENIVTLAVHPGFVATDMNEGGELMMMIRKLKIAFCRCHDNWRKCSSND
jgi:NAD(P)-dependent dehydrogenase (short-subunit alcohol dehydrogenase family)